MIYNDESRSVEDRAESLFESGQENLYATYCGPDMDMDAVDAHADAGAMVVGAAEGLLNWNTNDSDAVFARVEAMAARRYPQLASSA